MNFIDGIGLASAILIGIMFIPQVSHVYREKDTNALNYMFLCINMIASSMGLVYSVYYNVIPMIIANTSAGVFSLSLTTFKYLNEVKEETTYIDRTSEELPLQLSWCSWSTLWTLNPPPQVQILVDPYPLLAQLVEQWTVVPFVTCSIQVERTIPL